MEYPSNKALKIEELQEALRKKEEEMKQMEERYKKYLEKAKSVSTLSFVLVLLRGLSFPHSHTN